MVVALYAGIFGLGHHHEHGEHSGDLADHHCVLCHAQQLAAIEPGATLDGTPIELSQARLLVDQPRLAVGHAARLSPPLRGPPVV